MAQFDLTGFQRDLLTVIAGFDEPSGQEIKEELQSEMDIEINHGRLYPNLDTLVNKGLVEKGQLDRRTNFYALTDEGRDKIEAHLEWVQKYAGDEVSAVPA